MIVFFFFNDTATTEIYTLSLHDALPIFELLEDGPDELLAAPGVDHQRALPRGERLRSRGLLPRRLASGLARSLDRKSTRLNSSHANISYAVFCLKKKKQLLDHTCS